MVYPLLPVFLAGLSTVQGAAIYVGIMDGIAETVSGLLKLASGRLSDRTGKRKIWAFWGYTISCVTRSIAALAWSGWQVVGLRVIDRIGKGLRTSPRDALLAGAVEHDVRALAFSFHRMMDHMGALSGPLLALGIIYLIQGQAGLWRTGSAASSTSMHAMRWVFGLSLIPGLLASIAMWIKVSESGIRTGRPGGPIHDPIQRDKLPGRFYIALTAIGLFALGNSSDLFIILFAQEQMRLGPGSVVILWCLLHLSKILWSLPGGRLADRFGRSRSILIGWLIYMAVYAAIPLAMGLFGLPFLLLAYGAYYGLTEGAERALVAEMAPADMRGWAYGLYHSVVALMALPASLVFGLLFAKAGSTVAFLTGSALAGCAVLILLPMAVSRAR